MRPESRKKCLFRESRSASPGNRDIFSPFRFRPETASRTPESAPRASRPRPALAPVAATLPRVSPDRDPGQAGPERCLTVWTPEQFRGDRGRHGYTLGLGPIATQIWFDRTFGRLFRLDGTRMAGQRRTVADWASRCRAAAELKPLDNPRWPPIAGW